jgi:hypothetical protein
LAKGRLRRIATNKQKKFRKPKVYETISSIIEPSVTQGVLERLMSFFDLYHWEDFDVVFQTLIKQPEIKECLNQYCEFSQMFTLQANPSLPINRILDIYKVQFLDSKKTLQSFEENIKYVENLIIQSAYDEAKIKLVEHKEEFGYSIWFISTYFNVLALNNEYEEINKFVDNYSGDNDDDLFQLLLTGLYQKVKGADAASIVEDTTVNMNREFISGGEPGFAALFSLVFLPFPLYDDFETTEALALLQYFPLIDLYYYFTMLVTHFSAGNSIYEVEFGEPFIAQIQSMLNEMSDVIESDRLQLINSTFSIRKDKKELINNFAYRKDDDYLEYCKGMHADLIDRFERNHIYDLSNIMKLNIYAKSYIYLNRNPTIEVPFFIKDIIGHLIKIYRLDNCEKSISELLSIVIKHNNMEFSKYILVSLSNVYNRVITEEQHSKLKLVLTYGSTPISYSSKPAVLYNDNELNTASSSELSRLRFNIVNELNNFKEENLHNIQTQLKAYEIKTPIRKDFIEISAEFFMVANMYENLTAFSAFELLKKF